MKVAFIGSGHIAHVHGPAVKSRKGSEIVAVCDSNGVRARALAKSLGVNAYFADAQAMLADAKPDIVHILTPPATHRDLSIMAMRAGCHVFVEKPMAMTVEEAQEMLDVASDCGVYCCADHNMVYDPLTSKLRKMIRDGDIGRIVSVEAAFRFDINRYPAASAEGAQYSHWIYRLNGGPLQDLMPHPASLVSEFVPDIEDIEALQIEGGRLPEGWPEEVRVIVKSPAVMAYIDVSLHEKPDTTTLRVSGDRGTIEADYFSGIVSKAELSVLPRAARRALAGYRLAAQNVFGATANIFKVLVGRFDKGGGTDTLINHLYDAIESGADCPIDGGKLVNTVKLTNRVWPEPCRGLVIAQDYLRQVEGAGPAAPPTALVTGASGFIGTHILEKLRKEGVAVRALVRPNSDNAGRLVGKDVEVFSGDLTDADAVLEACEGIDTIYHAGSAMGGDWETFERATVDGTRNVIEAAQKNGVGRMLHISTMAVYELLDKEKGDVVREDADYHHQPRRMGAYAFCKIKAEELVKSANAEGRLATTIVRPGMVIGEGGYPFFPHLGFNLGHRVFLLIGKGEVVLPFTYVENTVDGIYRAATRDEAVGGIYNLVDDASITAYDYVSKFIEVTSADARIVRLPYFIPYAAMGGYEIGAALGILPKGKTSRAQLKWKQAPVRFDTTRAKNELGWQPSISMEEGMERTFKWFAKKYL